MEQETGPAEASPDCRIMKNKLLSGASLLHRTRKRVCVSLKEEEEEEEIENVSPWAPGQK